MTKRIVIAVDATVRSLDPIALGKLLATTTGAPAALGSVFAYHPFEDPAAEELVAVRADAEDTLRELARSVGLDMADVEIIPGNLAARELQRVTELASTGTIVVGSTSRGPVGRLLVGGVGDRLLTGSACPVAIAPNGYAGRAASTLGRVGVAFDGSDESRQALDAGRLLARASGAQLRLITVFQPMAFGEVAATRTGGTAANTIMRNELAAELEAAATGSSDGPAAEARFLEGSPGEVLARESEDLDLLITGSRGYGPRAAVLLGSTTHTLMRNAACPGLILPRGTSLDLT